MAKRKNLGKLALLGGAALLASRMMGGKEGKKDKDMPTETGAGAGEARDRLGGIGLDRGDMDTSGDASAGMARDRLADLERAGVRSPTRTSAPTRAAPSPRASEVPPPMSRTEEGAMASGLPREARGVRTAGSAGRDPSRYGKPVTLDELRMKKGGSVKAKPKMSSASKRADGCAMKGKTRGRMV